MVITNFFIKKELRKLAGKAPARPHQYRSFNDIRQILILCHTKDWDIVHARIEKLRAMNKTVQPAIYSPSRKDVPTWYSKYLLFCADKEIDWRGFPNKAVRQQFCEQPADLVIDLIGLQCPAMYYLILHHPATFKVGIKQSEQSVYDFSIIPPDGHPDIPYLFDQLLLYLQKIASLST